MTKRRVVVTGMGIISPVGNTLKQAWDNIVNGVSGIAPITHFDTADFATKIAGEIKDFEVTNYISGKMRKKWIHLSITPWLQAKMLLLIQV